MFELNIDTRIASVKRREKITAGSVGIQCGFAFSAEWDGLGKTAVFETDKHKIAIVLTAPTVTIPWEVCEEAGLDVIVGVYGTNGEGTIVIPTIYAKLGTVAVGATTDDADNAQTPTATDVQQITAAAANAVSTANTANTTADEAKGIAQSVEQRANAGEFDGEKGDKGDPGKVPDDIILVDGTPSDSTHMLVDTDGEVIEVLTAEDIAGLYIKPVNGIPERDLAEEVRNKLDAGGGSEVTEQTVREWGFTKFDGNYNSLGNKPIIPDAVTSATVSGWGFAKSSEIPEPVTDQHIIDVINAAYPNAEGVGF